MSEIDFSKLPVDTLVDCELGNSIVTLFYVANNGVGRTKFIVSHAPSTTRMFDFHTLQVGKIRISAKNPWLPLFGGECPVPHNCKARVALRDGSIQDYYCHPLDNLDRYYSTMGYPIDIIAYHLCESAWYDKDGVCDEVE